MERYVTSVSYDQTQILLDILQLHVPEHRIDCDATFSKGSFYKDGRIAVPQYRFDISPQAESVVEADSRHLPLESESIGCMVFDPPFLATKGKSLKENEGNIIARRFGVYPNEQSLHQFYVDSLREAYRVLKPRGILIFKCQDKVSSGKQYMSHVFIEQEAIKIGFYPKDLFVLLARSRLVAEWQTRNQKNARKYHSYFWVFQKDGPQIAYV